MLGLQVHSPGADHRPGALRTPAPASQRYNFHSYSGGGRMGFGLGLHPRAGRVHAQDRRSRLQLQPVRRLRRVLQVRAWSSTCSSRSTRCAKSASSTVRPCRCGTSWSRPWQKQAPTLLDRPASGASGPRTWTSRTTPTRRPTVVYHAGCLASTDEASGKVAAAAVSLLQEGRARRGHRQGRGALLRRPRLRDGLPRRGARAGRAERRPLQGVRGHGTRHRLRPLLPVLQGALPQAGPRPRS